MVCEKPCPSGRFATVTGWPSSRAASRNAAVCGRGSRWCSTDCGPAVPCVSCAAPSVRSTRRKYGSSEVQDQVVARGLGPLVVVGGEPAHPHHRVERRRAAEGLAARPVHRATAELRLRHRVVVPVEGASEELREGGRNVQLERRVGPARFEQQHRDRGILAQARRERGAGGTRADDDVVRLERGALRLTPGTPG